ncbi:MAG: hypothetical protein Q4A90_08055 [Streptococcus sp.]|nr:hypothetical protein [Streptococcus sp.]
MKNILKSEYLKFIYNKWLWLAGLSTIVLVPLFIIYLHETPNKVSQDYLLTQVMESYYLGQAGFMIICILYTGQEFTKSTLRTSLLNIPVRWKFFTCKLVIVLSMSTIIWGSIILLTFGIVKWVYESNIDESLLRVICSIFLESLSLSAICFGLTLLIKSTVFSLGICLSFLLGLGQMLLQFSDIIRYLPILSTMNLFFIKINTTFLSVINGLIIQNVWALAFIIASLVIFSKREVR